MVAYLIVVYIVCGIYLLLNFKHDIHMLQQNSYRLERYWKYLKSDIGSSWRLVDVAMLFLLFANLLDYRLSILIISIVCITKVFMIFQKKYKKPLVFTKRVWRIYTVVILLSLAIYIPAIILTWNKTGILQSYAGAQISLGILLIMTIFSWVIIMLAVVLLSPVEKIINRKYWNEASKILRNMPGLTVIGITGSYGKTSTKHYLHRILSEQFEVTMTPGSYNTTMGVIRTVREMLKPYDEIFICEMGAKQKGDIKEICDLVHPKFGIVTAVGPMHLESFKTMENIQSTKFELIDSLPEDGLAIINDDFEYCASRIVSNVESIRYSVDKKRKLSKSDYFAENIAYSPEGTTFTVKGPDNYEIELSTKLVGSCNISNLLAAVIVAIKLGMPKEKIRYAVGRIEQVEHRLNIKRTPAGVTIIDDAFNSNPIGSKMALEVLSGFKSGKRIVVTPGMIELGDRQFELNEQLGHDISKSSDIAIIVGDYNKESIVKGLKNGKFASENLYEVESFAQAQEVLSTILKSGDIILYENDLPDTFK